MTYPVRRVHYFSGQILTAEDLQAEQDYHRNMRYLRNRISGSGVVHGFEVTVGDGSDVLVSPGVAVDRLGREIVLVEEARVHLPPSHADAPVDLTVTWEQVPDGVVAAGRGDSSDFTRWIERPRLGWEQPDHSLVLARLERRGGDVTTVDVSVRRTHPGAGHWLTAD